MNIIDVKEYAFLKNITSDEDKEVLKGMLANAVENFLDYVWEEKKDFIIPILTKVENELRAQNDNLCIYYYGSMVMRSLCENNIVLNSDMNYEKVYEFIIKNADKFFVISEVKCNGYEDDEIPF